MKRLLLILVLGLGLFSETQAQFYFNRRDALHSFATIQSSVVERGGHYYTTALTLDSNGYIGNNTAYLIAGIRFTVYDAAGVKVRDTLFSALASATGHCSGPQY